VNPAYLAGEPGHVELHSRQNRFNEAIAKYETSLAFNRNVVNACAHIGRCKLFTGSAKEAILLHTQAIRLSPRDPDIGPMVSPDRGGTSSLTSPIQALLSA
jgi:tetratricopeptide (TPR) repeat protein